MNQATARFPRSIKINEEHTKTYATEDNLFKALDKLGITEERFMVVRTETGRWTAVFIGFQQHLLNSGFYQVG